MAKEVLAQLKDFMEDLSGYIKKLLIDVLFDENANVSEKDDAAMDLAAYDDPEIIQHLVKKGSDEKEDSVVLNSCKESLAEIWIRNDSFNQEMFNLLSPIAKKGAQFVIESRKK